ncbi:MAG: two-component regulator propeller domain-containing protein [Melioribacteraceae bacterium]
MYKLINNFLVLYCIVLASPVLAQLNPSNIIQFTEKDGVPGSQVSKVLIDKFGYVWIGTINGLARYDGYEFKRFYNDPNDPKSIKGLIIWSLFEDSKGRIWIASSPEILNLYDQITKSFKQYEYKHLIERQANVEIGILGICEDNKGRVYFGVNSGFGDTISSSLLYFDELENKVKKFLLPDSLIVQNVYNLINDKNGNIYINSATGDFKIDPNRKISRFQASIKELENSNEYVTDFNCDKDAHIWLITNKSKLIDFDPQTGKYKIYDPSEFDKSSHNELVGTAIVLDKDDNLWIGTRSGIYFFSKEKKRFESFSDPSINPIKNEIILDLKLDSFGSLWIGTQFGGLFKYEDGTLFNSYRFKSSEKNSLTPGWANNIYEAHDGKIWITTSGQGNSSGINIFDIKTRLIKPIPFQNFLPGSYVIFGLIEISPGEFLIATETGVYTFYPETQKVNKIELKGVPNSLFIHNFLKDKYENLWLCSFDGLYKKSIEDDEFKRYDLSQLQGSNEITGAMESKKHGLWLLTTNGLFLYNYKKDKIERHGFDKTKGDVFGTQDINSLHEDTQGVLWVGTWQGGLSKYNVETKKIKTYTRNDGLSSMSIQGILEDEDKDALWLSTFDGLSFFNIKTEKFNNFSIADGIQSQLFAESAYLKTSKGLFIFGGANGITVFNSNDVNNNSIPPKVFLTDLKLFNKSVIPSKNSILEKPIYETKEITFSYEQNNISLEFITLHYSNPYKNKTLYKLENFENVWRDAGSQHSAFYPNLSPGEYLFQVKAANNNGVWNEEGASLKIIIKSPWWQTTFAYIGYFFMFAWIVFGIDRIQRRRVIEKERAQAKEKELEQAKVIEKAYTELKSTQAQLIHSEKMASLGELTAGIAHEIKNPLNFVNNFAEISGELLDEMKAELQNDNKEEALSIANDLKQNLEKINQHGKRADSIVKGMLLHSRGSSGEKTLTDINDLLDQYITLAYHGLRAQNKEFNITIEKEYDETLEKINVIPEDMSRAFLNIINNACYAAYDKKKKSSENNFSPILKVSTESFDRKVEIRIGDNGNGIPSEILDKIFQPFFTTKPTGQGTGLGLSLSYDIVKVHGGELKVETKEGIGSEFIITLPA